MSQLEIHAYNVGFGDAILVRIPAEPATAARPFRDVLIDGGNSFMGEGGNDDELVTAMEAIHDLTGGRLDLYIMTHEHMDHVQGPGMLAKRKGKVFQADKVWMTASSEPSYYGDFPKARRRKRLADRFHNLLSEMSIKSLDDATQHELRTLLAINNPRKTADNVQHIREDITKPRHKPRYIHADLTQRYIKRNTPFDEAEIEIWAPEQDTSVYYGRMQHLSIANANGISIATPTVPPRGVSLAEFNRLIQSRRNGPIRNALMIDKAGNNSSVVFLMNWKGKRLLFAADAEEKSWRLMEDRGLRDPVDFLKVSHHGSGNGSPGHIFKTILAGRNGRRPVTLVSTDEGQYNKVPSDRLMKRLRDVSDLHDTRSKPRGEAVVIKFAPD